MAQKQHLPLRQSQLDKISTLGFTWKHAPGSNVLPFINRHFNGFRPLPLVRQVKALLEPLATTAVTKQWQLSEPPPTLSMILIAANGLDENTGLAFSRRFVITANGLEVHHDFFTLPVFARGRGIGKQILKEWFIQYERMGVRTIKVHATLQDGGYVWARAGFRAVQKTEVTRILNVAQQQLNIEDFEIVKGFYDDHYDNFPGKPFPIEYWSRLDFMEGVLRGSSWHGEIDLTNQFEFDNFKSYVSGKK